MSSSQPKRAAAEVATRPEAAVAALRRALVNENSEGVQRHRWLAPRPPGERDLFSDMAAAEGLDAAISKLGRFWSRAQTDLDVVRTVGDCEAEVYEHLVLPDETLPIVSLVRRERVGSPWQVVCSNEAHDERLRVWLTASRESIDEAAWNQAFLAQHGSSAELLVDDGAGIVGHPDLGWLAQITGPERPSPWPAGLPEEGTPVFEVSTALAATPEDRDAQLQWAVQLAHVTLQVLEGGTAYLPAHEKLIVPGALAKAAKETLTPTQRFGLFARLTEVQGHWVTTGLRQLALPELEMAQGLLSGHDEAALMRWLGATLVGSQRSLGVGTEILIDATTCLEVRPGRRGPRPGRSYGRWGALQLVLADPSARRGSSTRLRAPTARG